MAKERTQKATEKAKIEGKKDQNENREDKHGRVENSGVIDVNGRDFAMLVLCKCVKIYNHTNMKLL